MFSTGRILHRTSPAAWFGWCLLCLAVASCADLAGGQTDEPAATPEVAEAGDSGDQGQPVSPAYELDGKIETVGPDTFLLLDKQGNTKPVLGMSFEEFMAAWKLQQALRAEVEQAERAYTLDECQIRGTLESNHARLTATFRITLHNERAVEVPLRLSGAFLRRLPEGPARPDGRYLHYDTDRGGYVATLEGQPGETKRVELELIAAVDREGNRSQLRLLLPRATMGALDLESPQAIEGVIANGGVDLRSEPLPGGGMRVTTTGIGGELVLSWEDRREPREQLAPVLGATGRLVSLIDGRSVRTWARLTVESFGAPFREFDVRLPPGAILVTSDYDDPIASVLELDDAQIEEENKEDAGAVHRVTLKEFTKNPITFELKTEQPIGVAEREAPVELAGFEVLGAVRQDGKIGIRVDDEWQLRWDLGDTVEQINPNEIDLAWQQPDLVAEDLTAALRYFRQPWSLKVNVSPRRQRVVATPAYELTIEPTEARLRMTVDYQISGVRFPISFAPTFALEGWQVQDIVSRGLEDTEAIVGQQTEEFDDSGLSDDGIAEYGGFRSASATTDNPQVEVLLRQKLPPGREIFELPLPFPDQDRLTINSSEVRVQADTRLLVTPSLEHMSGLAPQPVDNSITARDNFAGQRFHYQGFQPRLVFAAHRQNRPQRVLVAATTRAGIRLEQVEVEQDLVFDVRHQMLDTLRLQAAGQLANLSLELLPLELNSDVEGTPLELPRETVGETVPTSPDLRITLPHPQLGKFRLRARFQLPLTPQSTDRALVIPLLSPSEGEWNRHVVTLESYDGRMFAPVAGSGWQVEKNEEGSVSANRVQFTTRERLNFLPLEVQGRRPPPASVAIDKIWVQTWLTSDLLQQRTVFQFRGTGHPVTIELPAGGIEGDEIEVTLDGSPATAVVMKGQQLEVLLPGDTTDAPHTLELRYRQPFQLDWIESLDIGRPRLAGNDTHAAMYWQVIAPVEFSFWNAADSLVSAFSRPLSSPFMWRVRSEQNTEELEAWIAAVSRTTPTAGEHAFLFRGGPAAPLAATWVRRELVVLGASTAILALCLSLVYVPWLRRPPLWLGGLIVLAMAGLAYPETTTFLAQAGLFGGLCAMIGVLLYLLARRAQPAVVSEPATVTQPTPSSGSMHSAVLPTGTALSTNAPTVSVEIADSRI